MKLPLLWLQSKVGLLKKNGGQTLVIRRTECPPHPETQRNVPCQNPTAVSIRKRSGSGVSRMWGDQRGNPVSQKPVCQGIHKDRERSLCAACEGKNYIIKQNKPAVRRINKKANDKAKPHRCTQKNHKKSPRPGKERGDKAKPISE